MNFLVDANVLCEAIRPRPHARVLAWLEGNDASLHVSTLTLAEIFKGICLLDRGEKRRKLTTWFNDLVASFSGRVIPFDQSAARVWGAFHARHQRRGRALPSFDSLIAATALAHDLALATRNVSDFPDELATINPWD